jgi:hypothetical protein
MTGSEPPGAGRGAPIEPDGAADPSPAGDAVPAEEAVPVTLANLDAILAARRTDNDPVDDAVPHPAVPVPPDPQTGSPGVPANSGELGEDLKGEGGEGAAGPQVQVTTESDVAESDVAGKAKVSLGGSSATESARDETSVVAQVEAARAALSDESPEGRVEPAGEATASADGDRAPAGRGGVPPTWTEIAQTDPQGTPPVHGVQPTVALRGPAADTADPEGNTAADGRVERRSAVGQIGTPVRPSAVLTRAELRRATAVHSVQAQQTGSTPRQDQGVVLEIPWPEVPATEDSDPRRRIPIGAILTGVLGELLITVGVILGLYVVW